MAPKPVSLRLSPQTVEALKYAKLVLKARNYDEVIRYLLSKYVKEVSKS